MHKPALTTQKHDLSDLYTALYIQGYPAILKLHMICCTNVYTGRAVARRGGSEPGMVGGVHAAEVARVDGLVHQAARALLHVHGRQVQRRRPLRPRGRASVSGSYDSHMQSTHTNNILHAARRQVATAAHASQSWCAACDDGHALNM